MLAFLRRYGTTRGIVGGSRAWTIVAIGAWSLHLLKRLGRPEPKVVFSEVLKPGQVLEVRHLPEPTRR